MSLVQTPIGSLATMDHDSSSRSGKSPNGDYGSDHGSQSKPASKRASRAGTRSVSTLSAAQLERKRANDREAQRAIRQRTKDHIESLERRISELTGGHDAREKLYVATQQRNRELEEENAYLRSRLSGEPFAINVDETEDKPPQYSVSAPESSPQTHLTAGINIPRPASSSTSRSIPQQPEAWRQHNQYSPGASSATGPFMSDGAQRSAGPNPASWRAQDISSTPAYGYAVRQTDRSTGYPSPAHQITYSGHPQAAQFQQAISAQAPPPTSVAPPFHNPGVATHTDFTSIPQYAPQAAYADQQSYVSGPAAVSSSASDFQAGRGSLAPSAYNVAATSSHFMPTQSTQSHNPQLAYRESTAQHAYSYDA